MTNMKTLCNAIAIVFLVPGLHAARPECPMNHVVPNRTAASGVGSGWALQGAGSRAEVEARIAALVGQRRFDEALSAYDAHAATQGKPDEGILRTIAFARLHAIADTTRDPVFLSLALERLAREGDSPALEQLKRVAASASLNSRTGRATLVSLARAGDREATKDLAAALRSAPPEAKLEIIDLLKATGTAGQAGAVAGLLTDPEPRIQAAAAVAVAALGYTEAVPRLEAMFRADLPLLRMAAAVALRRLGRREANAMVGEMLAHPVPEVRLMAAEGYAPAEAKLWASSVRQLLNDPNELIRLRAAEVLASCDAPSARTALAKALESPNPLLRREAAGIVERTGLADPALGRQLLGDRDEGVAIYGAGAVLEAARRARR